MPIRAAGWMYLHPPKTGGTTASSILRDGFGGVQVGGQHDPAWMHVEDRLPGERAWGTVRDPLGWYVSWYVHCRNNDQKQNDSLRIYGHGSREFRDVLYGATHPEDLRAPDAPVVIARLALDARDAFLRRGCGLATFLVAYTLGDKALWQTGSGRWLVDAVVPTDRLYDGMSSLLGTEITEARWPRRNERRTRAAGAYDGAPCWRDWYTEEMVGWVRSADADLYRLLGEFPALISMPSAAEVRP